MSSEEVLALMIGLLGFAIGYLRGQYIGYKREPKPEYFRVKVVAPSLSSSAPTWYVYYWYKGEWLNVRHNGQSWAGFYTEQEAIDFAKTLTCKEDCEWYDRVIYPNKGVPVRPPMERAVGVNK